MFLRIFYSTHYHLTVYHCFYEQNANATAHLPSLLHNFLHKNPYKAEQILLQHSIWQFLGGVLFETYCTNSLLTQNQHKHIEFMEVLFISQLDIFLLVYKNLFSSTFSGKFLLLQKIFCWRFPSHLWKGLEAILKKTWLKIWDQYIEDTKIRDLFS